MFVKILDVLIKRIMDSELIWNTKSEDEGCDKVISLNDLLDVIQILDDEERERILKQFDDMRIYREEMKKASGVLEDGVVDTDTEGREGICKK